VLPGEHGFVTGIEDKRHFVTVACSVDADDEVTLVEDEAQLERYADELLAAIERLIPRWVQCSLAAAATAGGVAVTVDLRSMVDPIAEATSRLVVPELRRLLHADVDAAAGSPLEALRHGVGPMTEALDGFGVEPVARDAFQVAHFPDDHYGLAPATFGDIDPSLHELGLMWGAARAHVHLRRRREDTK